MNFKVILKDLLSRFSEAGVEVALSGGLALSTMGVLRFTKDIDFVVLEERVEAVETTRQTDKGRMRRISSSF
jgi:hypothetical protein